MRAKFVLKLMKSKRNYSHKQKKLIVVAATTAKSPYWLAQTVVNHISKLSCVFRSVRCLYKRSWQLVNFSIDEKIKKIFFEKNKKRSSEKRFNWSARIKRMIFLWICFELAEKLRPLLNLFLVLFSTNIQRKYMTIDTIVQTKDWILFIKDYSSQNKES